MKQTPKQRERTSKKAYGTALITSALRLLIQLLQFTTDENIDSTSITRTLLSILDWSYSQHLIISPISYPFVPISVETKSQHWGGCRNGSCFIITETYHLVVDLQYISS